jgi:hypothetical protein
VAEDQVTILRTSKIHLASNAFQRHIQKLSPQLMRKIPRAGMRWRCLSNTFLPSPDPDLFLPLLTGVTFLGAKERDLDKIAGHSSVVRMFDKVCDLLFRRFDCFGLFPNPQWSRTAASIFFISMRHQLAYFQLVSASHFSLPSRRFLGF